MDEPNQGFGAAEPRSMVDDRPLPPRPERSDEQPSAARIGLRIWFVIVSVVGIGGLFLGQMELAGLAALAGLFAVAHAADRDPHFAALHDLLAWLSPVLSGSVFALVLLVILRSGADRPFAVPSLLVSGLGMLACYACLWPPVIRAAASTMFRTEPSSRPMRVATPLVMAGFLFCVPGQLLFRILTETEALPEESLLGAGALLGSLVGLTVLALGGVGFLVGRDFASTRERLGLRRLRVAHWGLIALGVVALFALNAGAELLQKTYSPATWQSDQNVNRMLVRNLSQGEMLLLGLSAGVGEELAVRGALQPRLGLVATSLLFAALHVQYSWIGMAVILALGLLLGAIRRKANTTAAIVVHGLYDIAAAFTVGAGAN